MTTIEQESTMSRTTTQRPAEDDQRPEQPETTPTPDETPVDQQEDAQRPDAGDEEGGEVGKLRREAAGHRAKLREAEAERDALTGQRDALAAAVLSDALRGTGVNAELFATAGRSITEFIGEGGLDRGAITAAGRDVAKQYGIASPARSPHTGTGEERSSRGKSWAEAIKG